MKAMGKNTNKSSCSNLGCAVWKHIQATPTYHRQLVLPTMGKRAADLYFKYDAKHNAIRVWRPNGSPDFFVGADDFKLICKRYRYCLTHNLIPPPNQSGGTAQFRNPEWPNPPLAQINTPYVAPLIRHVLQRNANLIITQPCC